MARKLKVLYVITGSDVGGAQKYVADLASHLDPKRFEAKILYGGKDIRWLSNHISPLFLWNDWLAIFELVRVFRREHPDIIHLNSSKAGVIGSCATGIYKVTCHMSHVTCPKVVFTAHGWVFNPSNYHSSLVRSAYVILHRIAARFCDVIVNVSEYDRNLALDNGIAPSRKLVTIHNGINPNIPFLNKTEARKEIARRLEIGISDLEFTAHPWVGSIGRLTPEKDYATLVAAAREIPDAFFFIIGAGPEKQKLQLLITKYQLQKRFFIVPPTGNDAVFLKAFTVFTLCSIKEGLPYTLLEAKVAGLPCVVTRAGGMPEVIESSYDAIVPQQNPQALATEIIRIASVKSRIQNTPANRSPLEIMVRETERVYH